MPLVPSRPAVMYNEIEPYAVEWLKSLSNAGAIPSGVVNSKSILDITVQECKPTSHFFAGIGGWAYALKLAGWNPSIPVWTGSCPCQPFSVAGTKKGEDDERHLWPAFYKLIYEYQPPIVFGEQVAGNAGCKWIAGVRSDLEGIGYAVAAVDLCAAGVAAPHNRSRLFWVAYTEGSARIGTELRNDAWSHYRVIDCTDSGSRRISEEPRDEPVVNGIPGRVGRTITGLGTMGTVTADDVKRAKRNKNGRLLGYGNAIVPQLAAVFIRAAVDVIQ